MAAAIFLRLASLASFLCCGIEAGRHHGQAAFFAIDIDKMARPRLKQHDARNGGGFLDDDTIKIATYLSRCHHDIYGASFSLLHDVYRLYMLHDFSESHGEEIGTPVITFARRSRGRALETVAAGHLYLIRRQA